LLPYPDQVHLSIEGHRLYAACIEPYFNRALADLAPLPRDPK
jgi:hypothetical protein